MKFAFVPKKPQNLYQEKKNKILLEELKAIWYDLLMQTKELFHAIQLLPLCSARVSFIPMCCTTAWKPYYHISCTGCLMLEQVQHPEIPCTTPSDIIFFCPFPSRKDNAHFSCSCFYLSEMAAYAITFSQCIFPRSSMRYDLCKQSAIILTNHSS